MRPVRERGLDDLLDAVDVAGEARGDDALALVVAEQVAQHRADTALARRVTRLLGVGGVGQQQADAVLVGDATDARQIGDAAVDGREVELEVAGVQDHALRCVERGGEPVGHRVGDGDELAVEGPDAPPLAVDHGDELGAVEQARLLDAAARQAERERGAVDRERQVAQQKREPADVVLVTVGDDAAFDARRVLAQPREVGEHEVDAEHVGVGEHEAAVEQQDAAVLLERRAVAADLAETAEEGDADRVSHDAQARRFASTSSARSSSPSGAGPIGSRHWPTGRPSTRIIALVGMGLGVRSPVSNV